MIQHLRLLTFHANEIFVLQNQIFCCKTIDFGNFHREKACNTVPQWCGWKNFCLAHKKSQLKSFMKLFSNTF